MNVHNIIYIWICSFVHDTVYVHVHIHMHVAHDDVHVHDAYLSLYLIHYL